MPESATPRGRQGWSAPAKRAFREVLEASPGLEKAKLTGLYGACDLLSQADAMQVVIDADGYVVKGSQDQPVAHPLVAEVRQYRKQALDVIRSLELGGRSAASAGGAALAGKRWSSRPATVTPIREASAPF